MVTQIMLWKHTTTIVNGHICATQHISWSLLLYMSLFLKNLVAALGLTQSEQTRTIATLTEVFLVCFMHHYSHLIYYNITTL